MTHAKQRITYELFISIFNINIIKFSIEKNVEVH